MSAPDVTVIVAAYNAMPYLRACLASLAEQTIGIERIQIVAVDDGSTDGSGAELDAFAARHPGTVAVVHQANSGGPAAPDNRALDLATGRYVFFVGADDYLDREALERLVGMADLHGSDVVFGRMVGVDGRSVPRAVFRSTEPRIGLVGSGALYALSNTKLFRRSLIEEHGLRFPEDLPIGSDMPFTLEALLRARTISVLADHDCYFAVRRRGDANITFHAACEPRLRVAVRALELIDERVGPGEIRDELAVRLLKVDVARIFGAGFLAMDEPHRDGCTRATAAFVERQIGDGLQRLEPRLPVPQRLLYRRVLGRDSAAVAELVGMDVEDRLPSTLLEADRAYALYPGFRESGSGIADDCYRLLGPIAGRLGRGTRLVSAAWVLDGDRLALDVAVHLPVVGTVDTAVLRLADAVPAVDTDRKRVRLVPAGEPPGPAVGELVIEPTADGSGTLLRARIPVEPRPSVHELRATIDAGGATYEIAVRRPRAFALPRAIRWNGARHHLAAVEPNSRGGVSVTVAPSRNPLDPLLRAARVRARFWRR